MSVRSTRRRRGGSRPRSGSRPIEDTINELDQRLTEVTEFHLSNAEEINKTNVNLKKLLSEIKKIYIILGQSGADEMESEGDPESWKNMFS